MRSQIDGAFKWIMGWYGSAQEAAPWDEQLRADLLAASIAALTRSGHPQSPALAERLAHPLERLRLLIVTLGEGELARTDLGERLVREASAIEPAEASALAIAEIIPRLQADQRRAALQRAFDRLTGQQVQALTWRLMARAALVAGAFDRAISVAEGIDRQIVYGSDQYGEAHYDLAQGLPLSALPALAIQVAQLPADSIWGLRALLTIVERAPTTEHLRLAEEAALRCPDPDWPVRALVTLHSLAPAPMQRRLRATIAEIAEQQSPVQKAASLISLVPLTPEEESAHVLDVLFSMLPLPELIHIGDFWESIAPHLDAARRDATVTEYLRAPGRSREMVGASSAVRRIAVYLSGRTRPRALKVARRIVRLGREAPDNVPQRLNLEHGLLHGALALLAIASAAPPDERHHLIDEVLALYAEIELSAFRGRLLEPLRDLLPRDEWDNRVAQLYQRQRGELTEAREIFGAVSAIEALSAITRYLQEEQLRDLVTLAMTVDLPYWQHERHDIRDDSDGEP